MKKIFLFGISAMMACSLSFSALAAPAAAEEVKTIEIAMEDVIDYQATRALSANKTLTKDSATTFTTGIITSVGQVVDLSRDLPAGATVTKVTIYCPSSVKVTQSRFTSIENFLIDNGDKEVTVKFWQTDRPPTTSSTTVLNGNPNNLKWIVKVQGKTAMNESGMDGFTVGGGCKLIVEYK